MKILVFSSTRADAGILKPLVEELSSRDEIDCRVLLTGSHSRETQGSVDKSELASIVGITLDFLEYLDANGSGQSANPNELGVALTRFIQYFEELSPQLLILLGDRTEVLLAAIAANLCGVPVAHIHGGELTLGALDELHRHAISKLSQVHFPADSLAAGRLLSLAERPESVYMIGSLRDDFLREFNPLSRRELSNNFGIPEHVPLVSVAIHPSTYDAPSTDVHLDAFLSACEGIEAYFVFTGVNVDRGSENIREKILTFIDQNPGNAIYLDSLGSDGFLSLLSHSQVACGNSSSLVLEAPKLGTPTVILGRRQEGRVPKSTCLPADSMQIREALLNAMGSRASGKPIPETKVAAGMTSAILAHDFTNPIKEFYDHRLLN